MAWSLPVPPYEIARVARMETSHTMGKTRVAVIKSPIILKPTPPPSDILSCRHKGNTMSIHTKTEDLPGLDTSPAFRATRFHVDTDTCEAGYRRIDTVASWCAKWDGMPAAKLALFSDVTNTHAYCRIEITGRAVRYNRTQDCHRLRVRVTFLESGYKVGGSLFVTGGHWFETSEAKEAVQ